MSSEGIFLKMSVKTDEEFLSMVRELKNTYAYSLVERKRRRKDVQKKGKL